MFHLCTTLKPVGNKINSVKPGVIGVCFVVLILLQLSVVVVSGVVVVFSAKGSTERNRDLGKFILILYFHNLNFLKQVNAFLGFDYFIKIC